MKWNGITKAKLFLHSHDCIRPPMVAALAADGLNIKALSSNSGYLHGIRFDYVSPSFDALLAKQRAGHDSLSSFLNKVNETSDLTGLAKLLKLKTDLYDPEVSARIPPYCTARLQPKQTTGSIKIGAGVESSCLSRGGLI
jgi:hypothetical protein